MKFLCDQMLVRLGRWLRAAGYDTVVIETPLTDREILDKALKENRYLITRDRHFLDMKEAEGILVWLEANAVEECVEELSRKVLINWVKSPFSRCLLCNEVLKEAEPEVLDRVPEDVRLNCKEFWRCEKCGKIYWMGSHTKRMLSKLREWA
ncbi:MAG: DUF5615 family PIN-like protein [Waddliaceae bacterium]